MNPEYIVLGGLWWKLWRKKITLWYTHKSVNLKLRIATKLADKIFTASEKSFRLVSKKVNIMGHGINIEQFIPTYVPLLVKSGTTAGKPALQSAKEKIIRLKLAQ